MEILVIGLLIVALMAWASTRIKRNAAAAYEAETIETDDLVVRKPEGFLHVLNDESGLLFRAYSKDYGTVGRRNVRQANIEAERHQGAALDAVLDAARAASESFEADAAYIDAGERAVTARSVRVRDGGECEVLHKFVTRGSNVIEVRAEVLAEHKEAHMGEMEETLETLRVK